MKKAKKKGFTLPSSMESVVRSLKGDALEQFIAACFDYNKGEEVTIQDPIASMVFSVAEEHFKREEEIRAIHRECGRKGGKYGVLGGRPKETPKNPKKPQNEAEEIQNTNNQCNTETPNGVIESFESFFSQKKIKEEKNENEEKEVSPCTPLQGKEEKDKKEENRNPLSARASEITRALPDKYTREFLDYCTDDMFPIFRDWLIYKRQAKHTYKSPMSMKMAYNKLVKMSKGHPDIARIIIDDAIANNYIGFFPLTEKVIRVYIDPTDQTEEFWERVISKFNLLGIVPISKETLDDERKVMFMSILKKYGPKMIGQVYGKIKISDRMHGINNGQWKADFDFVFTDKNFKRIYDGSFDNPKL